MVSARGLTLPEFLVVLVILAVLGP
ncbi:prepilin-type N-terminal cleavage/methylation domain-containing protein [Thermus oshimai]